MGKNKNKIETLGLPVQYRKVSILILIFSMAKSSTKRLPRE